jgi:hypothetical protein
MPVRRFRKYLGEQYSRGYCCRDYVDMPVRRNIRIRMTESGDPFDNVVAGLVCGILKTGRMYDGKPGAWQESGLLTGKITDLCHHQTPRRRIGYILNWRKQVNNYEINIE